MVKADSRQVSLGRITGVYGVRGWVRVNSDTEPPARILQYRCWQLNVGGRWRDYTAVEGRRHHRGLVVKLDGVDDRDAAATLTGAEIAVARSELPELDPKEYYWVDLVGAEVVTRDGVPLGRVDHVMATGANDVLVVAGERERMIPFVHDQVVIEVDLEAKRITVDWDPAF